MSFRTKVFLSITATVLIAVWVVAAVVSSLVTDSFERRDEQRTSALVSEFRREFDRRGQEVTRRIEAIANSDAVQRIAVDLAGSQPDTSRFVDDAQALARTFDLHRQLRYVDAIFDRVFGAHPAGEKSAAGSGGTH